MKQTKFFNVYEQKVRGRTILLTKNLVPGRDVYGEKLIVEDGIEYREWDAMRSKIAAFILKGADQIAIKPGAIVLYLGASTGTTVSHVSDIVGDEGFVFAVDIAPITTRKLVFLAEKRGNIAPILADSNKPEAYLSLVSEADVVFQDIAQRNQVDIFLKNVNLYLKEGGFALLAVKARSVDVAAPPKKVFQEVKKTLEQHLKIIDSRILDPFQKDHIMFLCKK